MQATVSLDSILQMLQSLSPDSKRWLAAKLCEEAEAEEAKERLTPYTVEEINRWLDESEADEKAGRTYTCAEVRQMMEAKYPWLCK